jgi:hypothetical protein
MLLSISMKNFYSVKMLYAMCHRLETIHVFKVKSCKGELETYMYSRSFKVKQQLGDLETIHVFNVIQGQQQLR